MYRFDVVAVGAATINELTSLDSSSEARRECDAALVTAQAHRQRLKAMLELLDEGFSLTPEFVEVVRGPASHGGSPCGDACGCRLLDNLSAARTRR